MIKQCAHCKTTCRPLQLSPALKRTDGTDAFKDELLCADAPPCLRRAALRRRVLRLRRMVPMMRTDAAGRTWALLVDPQNPDEVRIADEALDRAVKVQP